MKRNDTGAYSFDRDEKHLHQNLNFLRCAFDPISLSYREKNELAVEAICFSLVKLVDFIEPKVLRTSDAPGILQWLDTCQGTTSHRNPVVTAFGGVNSSLDEGQLDQSKHIFAAKPFKYPIRCIRVTSRDTHCGTCR
jgi:hypothetical protein